MPVRHWAYFSQADGRCVGEAERSVRAIWLLRLAESWCPWLANKWAQFNARAAQGIVAIDVTALRLSFGDFIWAHFDADLRQLSFPHRHHFLTVDRETGFIYGNTISGRPVPQVEGRPDLVVLDVIGRQLQNEGPWVHGVLNPATGEVTKHRRHELEAASIDLDLFNLAGVRDAVIVGA